MFKLKQPYTNTYCRKTVSYDLDCIFILVNIKLTYSLNTLIFLTILL